MRCCRRLFVTWRPVGSRCADVTSRTEKTSLVVFVSFLRTLFQQSNNQMYKHFKLELNTEVNKEITKRDELHLFVALHLCLWMYLPNTINKLTINQKLCSSCSKYLIKVFYDTTNVLVCHCCVTCRFDGNKCEWHFRSSGASHTAGCWSNMTTPPRDHGGQHPAMFTGFYQSFTLKSPSEN